VLLIGSGAVIELQPSPQWLSSHDILALFHSDAPSAIKKFQEYVALGSLTESPWPSLKHQIYLGSDDFIKLMKAKINPNKNLSNIPKPQHVSQPPSLVYIEKQCTNRDDCIVMAYLSGGFSMTEIGHYIGLHYSRVSRIIKNRRLELKGA
jgi:putative transposase